MDSLPFFPPTPEFVHLPWNVFRNPGPGTILALGALLYILLSSYRKSLKGKLPPGPRGLPLFGNAFQLPPLPWFRMTEWKEQFGPIFSLNLAGQPMIVLNSHKVAADLLDRRSATYSDRPRFVMAGEILTGNIFIAFSRYGDLWRRLRKAAHEGLNIRAVEAYEPLQEKEAAVLAEGLLKEPQAWDSHLKRSAASTVLSAVYGVPPIASTDDPLVTRINDLMHRLVRAVRPGAYMVDIFPTLKYIPSWAAKWKREGLEWHSKDTKMFTGFYRDVRKRALSGECEPCFSMMLLDKEGIYEKEAAWLAGTVFGAGAETTAAALSVFMLAMALYPNVMSKAQAEIDAVVGRSRLPTFADRENLPYIRAIVKEVLRWRSVGPLGLPHRSLKDDVYEGHFIPKGSIVIANAWAMNRDPAIFPDFDVFRPERFLDATGQVDIYPVDTHGQGHVTFGFGRRICVGMNVANNALFIDIATMLWAVNIEKAKDAQGNVINPDPNECIDEGLVVRPAPFPCSITPRTTEVMETLAQVKQASRT